MQLSARDVAKLLNVSDKTIYRWIKEGKIPAYRINDSIKFNKAELLEWATSKRINISPDIFLNENSANQPLPSLADTIRAGGIYYRVGGHDVKSVLSSIVDIAPLPESVDPDFLLQVLLARESMGSTAVGKGISIPHPRNPIISETEQAMISLCFLDQPVDFNSLDGQPVHAIFLLISPLIRTHLNLISRISFSLQHPSFMDLIQNQASREEILQATAEIDQKVGNL